MNRRKRRQQRKELGAHSFLVKPLKFKDLLQLNCVLPANKSLKITSVPADDPENVQGACHRLKLSALILRSCSNCNANQ